MMWNVIKLTTQLIWSAWLVLPSSLRMIAYRYLAFIGKRWYGDGGSTQRLPFNLYMKYGPRVRMAEAVAMIVVAQSTTIPVPQVLDTVKGSRGVCILMTRLPGVSFGQEQTLYDLSSEQLHDFEATLRDWFSQLRSIPVPPTALISSIDGSACRCYRVKHDHDFGPFATERDLYGYILCTIPMDHHRNLLAKLDTLYSRPHRLLFSHADLHPNNFLVYEGRLSGFIDWECAGWYPEYWDYTNALYLRSKYRLWCEIFTRVFPQYGPEHEVEHAFWMVANPY